MRRVLRDAGEKRRLLRQCARKVADLQVPDPLSIPALVVAMELAAGRRIRLVALNAWEGDLRTACGLRAWDSEGMRVLYRPRCTPHQTEHVVLHELAHEWLGHDNGVLFDEAAQPSSDVAKLVRPGQAVQTRASYSSTDEHVAELTAYLLKQRLHSGRASGDDLLSRLESTLSRPLAPPHRSWQEEAA